MPDDVVRSPGAIEGEAGDSVAVDACVDIEAVRDDHGRVDTGALYRERFADPRLGRPRAGARRHDDGVTCARRVDAFCTFVSEQLAAVTVTAFARTPRRQAASTTTDLTFMLPISWRMGMRQSCRLA